MSKLLKRGPLSINGIFAQKGRLETLRYLHLMRARHFIVMDLQNDENN
jgi:hypothetical protein